MDNQVKVDFTALENFFRSDRNVVCALAFGSARNGLVRPGGDLDLAVLFREPPPPGDPWLDYYLRVCDMVPEVEKIDLVCLNSAATILAFEALSGRMICRNDAEATAAFTSQTCREYEDVMGNLRHQYALCRSVA